MNPIEFVGFYVGPLVTQLPVVVLALAGLAIAILKREQLSSAFAWSVWGLSLIVVSRLVSVVLTG